MLRARYIEITRRRWYDIAYLIVITVFTGIVHIFPAITSPFHVAHPVLFAGMATLSSLALVLPVYLLVNELTHRHHQAFVTAAVLATTNGIIRHPSIPGTEICGSALILLALYFLLKALRRYGPQWYNMMGFTFLLTASVFIAGIEQVYTLALPFLAVITIVVRPIIHYKKVSLPVSLLLVVVLTVLPGLFHPVPSVSATVEQLSQGIMCNDLIPVNCYDCGIRTALSLAGAGLWSFVGLVAVCYALRSQRIHGDLAALVGVWWLILAIVLIQLYPCMYGSMTIALLVPFSFTVGAYLNLLSLPRRLRSRDRHAFRITLVVTALFFVATALHLCSGSPLFTFKPTLYLLFTLVLLGQVLYIVHRCYKIQTLPIRLFEISFLILAILLAS